ncbi:MAG: Do family serine endopeptidase [Pyrinomonadaceae bacterium]
MKNKTLLALALIAATLFSITGCGSGLLGTESSPPSSAPAAPPAPMVVDGMRTSYADIVDRTSPAVVRIEADQKRKSPANVERQSPEDFFRQFQQPQQEQRPQIERGLGSGVMVDANGHILTNNHVVEGAEKITIAMSDNKTYEAKVVGLDAPSDLAVLKIEATGLPFLNLGDSDTVRVGDIVLAIGNPLGIGQTVTAGIISAKGRRTGLSDGSYEDFLQTDAPINRGNSGGALVSLNGELIGINSQILSGGPSGGSIGIGFSIPSNMAKSVMDQLIQNGRVRRGLLGVGLQNITDDMEKALELTEKKGALVGSVQRGSSADKAGIKRGDIITAINGERIEDRNILRNKIAGTAPGTEIKLTVSREGRETDLSATLDEFKAEDSRAESKTADDGGTSKENQSGKLGVTLEPVTPEITKRLGLENEGEGLLVTQVEQSGPAAEAGLSRGDVILEVNRRVVKSIEDVRTALDGSGGRPVLLLVATRGRTIYLTVRPE